MSRIDRERCIGCGICAGICPDGIEMKEGKASIKNEKAACLKEAASSCPRGAIALEGDGNKDTTKGTEDSDRNYNQGRGFGQGGQGRGMGAGRGRGMGMGPRDGRGRGMGGGGRRKW